MAQKVSTLATQIPFMWLGTRCHASCVFTCYAEALITSERPGSWCWNVPCVGARQIDVSAMCPAGLVTGQRPTTVASRTLAMSAGVKPLKRSPSRVCPCHVRAPWAILSVKLSSEVSTSVGVQDPEEWKRAFGGPTSKPSTNLLETVRPPAAYSLQ